jgi:hypothetical protein
MMEFRGKKRETYIWSVNVFGPANHNLILLSRGGLLAIISAANTTTEKKVEMLLVFENIRTLTRMCARAIELDPIRRLGAHSQCIGRHSRLKDVAPEAAECHVVFALPLKKIWVNRIIVVSAFRAKASAPVIYPRSWIHCSASRNADGAFLRAKGAYGIVAMIYSIYEMNIWRPSIVAARVVDAAAIW